MKTAKSNYLRIFLTGLIILMSVGLTNIAFSQDEEEDRGPQDLATQFDELKENSESYNAYKVIKTSRLNSFWKEVVDSLNGYRRDLVGSGKEIAQLNSKINQLTAEVDNLKIKLDESEARNSTIGFLGMEINKSVYNTIVWSIMGGLVFLTISMFLAFKNNKVVTRKAKKDYQDVLHEFEEYRKTSREKQMKLGRELQTERNKLEEIKDRLGKAEKLHSK